MPRQLLATLPRGQQYDFPAGVQTDGTIFIAFEAKANQHAQTTLEITIANGGVHRHDKLTKGTGNAPVRAGGPYIDILSVKNIGPAKVDVAIDW